MSSGGTAAVPASGGIPANTGGLPSGGWGGMATGGSAGTGAYPAGTGGGAGSGGGTGGVSLGGTGAAPLGGTGGVPVGGTGGALPGGTGGLPVGGTGGAPLGGTGGTGGSGVTGGTGGSVTGGSAGTGGSVTGGSAGTGGSFTGGIGGSGATGGNATGGAGGAVDSGQLFTVTAQLASDVDGNAPGTVGIVTWSIDSITPESAVIEFGLDDGYGTTAPVDLTEAQFRTLLLGMKPSRTYHFRVVVTAGGVQYASDDYVIDTGPPTTAVSIGNFSIADASVYERGFVVTSYWQGTGASVAFIVDADGEIVWWYRSGINGIARARMSEDGKNMWMVSASNQGNPLERVSLDTLDAQTYSNRIASHDLTAVSGQTMAYLDYGENDCNSIFEIDPSGAATEVFETAEYLSGMCHSNALRYSQAEDVYVMTDVSQDIFVINRADGSVSWRVSEILPGGISTLGGTQHAQHLLDDGILIFANRWNGQNASAAVQYDLSGQQVWLYEGNQFSANLGDVQRLPGGNTMVTYSNDSIVRQVTPDRDVVMQFSGPSGTRFGYALWRETLYGPPPDILE